MAKLCVHCSNQLVQENSKQKFCNNSCAASYNNKGIRRHGNPPIDCQFCNIKTRNKKFCSKLCSQKQRIKDTINAWRNGEKSGVNSMGLTIDAIKEYLRIKYNNSCCICSWNTIHPKTKIVPLEVDHIDGNWRNNLEENLRLLCPNCHSLTDTYKGLNKGRGRSQRINPTN
jgi:hypothetical protein